MNLTPSDFPGTCKCGHDRSSHYKERWERGYAAINGEITTGIAYYACCSIACECMKFINKLSLK